MVAECYQGELKGAILGFMVYQLKKGYMDLLTLAVHPWVRRKGVGTKLTDKIKNKVTATNRTSVQLKVRESNLETQLFLRKTGFFCKGTVADFYFDGFHTENAYEFEYRIPIDDLL
jgi:ribosomal protein S18 acetylase RimI-like enzyme